MHESKSVSFKWQWSNIRFSSCCPKTHQHKFTKAISVNTLNNFNGILSDFQSKINDAEIVHSILFRFAQYRCSFKQHQNINDYRLRLSARSTHSFSCETKNFEGRKNVDWINWQGNRMPSQANKITWIIGVRQWNWGLTNARHNERQVLAGMR